MHDSLIPLDQVSTAIDRSCPCAVVAECLQYVYLSGSALCSLAFGRNPSKWRHAVMGTLDICLVGKQNVRQYCDSRDLGVGSSSVTSYAMFAVLYNHWKSVFLTLKWQMFLLCLS